MWPRDERLHSSTKCKLCEIVGLATRHSLSDPLGSGIRDRSSAPKGRFAGQSMDPLTELSLGLCDRLLMPLEQPGAGAGDRPAAVS